MCETQSVQRAAQLCSTQRERELLQRNPLLPHYGMQREFDVMRDVRVAVLRKRTFYRKILPEAPALQRIISNYLHQCPKRPASSFLSVVGIMKHRFNEDTLQSINRFV